MLQEKLSKQALPAKANAKRPVGCRNGNGWVDRLVGLPVGSRFFDRPVKLVETTVEFSFLVAKRHLSNNRNIHIYISLSFGKQLLIKNSTNKPRFLKTLVEWFQVATNMLLPLRHAHPGAYLGGALCHAPVWGTAQGKKCKI